MPYTYLIRYCSVSTCLQRISSCIRRAFPAFFPLFIHTSDTSLPDSTPLSLSISLLFLHSHLSIYNIVDERQPRRRANAAFHNLPFAIFNVTAIFINARDLYGMRLTLFRSCRGS